MLCYFHKIARSFDSDTVPDEAINSNTAFESTDNIF